MIMKDFIPNAGTKSFAIMAARPCRDAEGSGGTDVIAKLRWPGLRT
jgi:hypothetical protein